MVLYGELKRGVNAAFFTITSYVQIGMVGSTIRESVNQVWVAMKIKNDGLVCGK